MKWLEIMQDSFLGFLFIFIFSYLLHNEQKDMNNIMLFVWASPTAYFYLLYLVFFRSRPETRDIIIKGFVNNITLGLVLGLFVITLTILLLKFNFNTYIIFFITALITILSTLLYYNQLTKTNPLLKYGGGVVGWLLV